jgi:hypothetical protein
MPTKIDKLIYLLANIWEELPRCSYGAHNVQSPRGYGRLYKFYFEQWNDGIKEQAPIISLFSLIGQDNKDSYHVAAQQLIDAWRHYWSISE